MSDVCEHGSLKRKCRVCELEEQVKELEQRLGNLLARIHGDGGHYITEHGWEKAEADADAKIVQWLAGERGEPVTSNKPIPWPCNERPILGDEFVHTRTGMKFHLTEITYRIPENELSPKVEVVLTIK